MLDCYGSWLIAGDPGGVPAAGTAPLQISITRDGSANAVYPAARGREAGGVGFLKGLL